MKTMLAISLLTVLVGLLFACAALTGFREGSPDWIKPASHAVLDLAAGSFILWTIFKRRRRSAPAPEEQP